jgi:hypothetical protein
VPHYRVYKLNPAGRIVTGEWIQAADDDAAKAAAHDLCDEATPTVEVWQGSRRLGVLPCDESHAAA